MPGPTADDLRRMAEMNPPERREMAEALVRNGWRVRRRDSGGYIWHKVTNGTPEFPIGAEMREENIPEEQKQ